MEAPLSTFGVSSRKLLPLTLTPIGVVCGDIGTRPLYALRECFFGSHSVPATDENVLGVLSYVVPVAVAILIAGFAIQQHGTHRVGGLFGPIMVVWFVVIAFARRDVDAA